MVVLLVEDDKALGQGLKYAITKEGYEVIWTTTGEEALHITQTKSISLVVLDIRLPGIDGFTVCRKLRSFTHIPVLILTAKDEEIDKINGFSIGADDYVTKPFSVNELLSRIQALTRRSYEYSKHMANLIRIKDMEIDIQRHKVSIANTEVHLTPTEYEILLRLARQPGVVLSRDALIEGIWGIEGEYITEQNINVHIRRVREKIEDNPSSPQYLLTVKGYGYKIIEGGK